jgi:hypothetical protein
MKLSIALSGGIVLEEAVDLSSDRLLMMMMDVTCWYNIPAFSSPPTDIHTQRATSKASLK